LQTETLIEALELLGEDVADDLQLGLMQLHALVHPMKNTFHTTALTAAFMLDFCERNDVPKEDFLLVFGRFSEEINFLDWDLKVFKRGKQYTPNCKVYKLEEGKPTP
jgi:hypothetical protein